MVAPDYRPLVAAIQAALTPDLLRPDQVRMLTGVHPTEGHCAVAAEAAYYLLGGKAAGWVPHVLPRVVLGDNTHWWVGHRPSGVIVDPTAEQFGGDPIPYHLGRGCGFQSAVPGRPSRRALTVISRVLSGPAATELATVYPELVQCRFLLPESHPCRRPNFRRPAGGAAGHHEGTACPT